jgi:hypothetical protein
MPFQDRFPQDPLRLDISYRPSRAPNGGFALDTGRCEGR